MSGTDVESVVCTRSVPGFWISVGRQGRGHGELATSLSEFIYLRSQFGSSDQKLAALPGFFVFFFLIHLSFPGPLFGLVD